MTQNASPGTSRSIATAASVGLCVGTLLGAIEGLRTLADNVHARPGSYAAFFLGAPLLLTSLASLALALPVGALAAGRAPDRVARCCATAILAGATLLTGAFWRSDLRAALAAIGSEAAWVAALAAFSCVAIGGVAALGFGAATGLAWHGLGRNGRRMLTASAALLNVALVPALGAYWVTEGEGVLHQSESGAARAPGERNVLLITLDTVRADRVGANHGDPPPGTSLTPAIDAVARDGAWFANAISTSSWTLPSVASLLTGELPREHGAGWSRSGLDLLAKSPLRGGPTLARSLAEHGYLTQAFVTNPYLSVRYGLSQGFAGYENLTLESEIGETLRGVLVFRALRALAPELLPRDRADAVVDRAVRWLRRRHDRKFLVWVHFIDPHAPYVDPSEGAGTSFRGDTLLGMRGGAAMPQVAQLDIARMRSGEIHLDAAQRQQLVRLYDLEVAFVDDQVGRLLRELAALGLADDTLVAIVSDHGEEFWDHGGVEHGHTLHDELIRVPLVLRGPGVPRGLRYEPLVRTTDLAPTLLDLLGLPPLPSRSGASLLPDLVGARHAPRVASSENLLFAEPHTAVRTDALKYIAWSDGHEELYELGADPAERRDLSTCADLAPARALHAASFASVPRRAVTNVVEPDPLTRSALQSLGYVE